MVKIPSTDGQFVSRRRFVQTGGVAGALAIAGCLSGGDDEGGNGNGGNGGNGNDDDSNGNGGNGDGDELSGEVVVTGSSTVFPISDAMAQRFMDEHPNVNVTVDPTGSGGGFANHFCHGDSDINGASRPIKDEELNSCRDNDVEPIEMRVAGDALTMAVSPENDWVDCMSFDEMAQIWREDGAETWADVDPEWPDEEFVLHGPDTTSGTFDWFTENVVGEAGNHRTDYEPTEKDNQIVQALESNPYALGYFGYAYYAENQDRIKALSVKENEDDECGEPSLQAASEGTYPMSRPLFIYPSEEAIQREEVYEFLKFYIENSGEDWIADDVRYVPANEDTVEENLSALEDAR